jgi:tetratricopeptide (TPR) repeat protein
MKNLCSTLGPLPRRGQELRAPKSEIRRKSEVRNLNGPGTASGWEGVSAAQGRGGRGLDRWGIARVLRALHFGFRISDFTPPSLARLLASPCGLAVALALAGCGKGPEPPAPSPGVEALNRGVSLMGQYQYDAAAQAFEEVVKARPDLTEARVNLAIARFNRNRKEDQDLEIALRLLEEVLQKEPDHLRALYFKGIVLQHVGKAEEAVPCFETVVRRRPDDGAAWYLLAVCRHRSGQPAEADFQRALQHRPYLYSAYYQLYQIQMRAGREEEAKASLEQFKKLRESPLGESIELPQYNQMGELALATPPPAAPAPPVARSRYQLKPPQTLLALTNGHSSAPPPSPLLPGAAAGDLNRDGMPDLVVPLGAPGRLALLRQTREGQWVDATAGSGLEGVTNAVSGALGDFDNDDAPDLFVTGAGSSRLFKGHGDGALTDVTSPAGLIGLAAWGRSALWLDADHDGDLDLFLCAAEANQLWNNNGDGVFTNIAGAAVACADSRPVLVLPGDLDRDRDLDLVILRAGQPARICLNELLGQYREGDWGGVEPRGDLGGVWQDFNGDGAPDLLVLGGQPVGLKLFLGDGRGRFKPSEAFAEAARAAASWGPLRALRAADLDLDGDLDVVCLAAEAHALLNDGHGRFVLQGPLWKPVAGSTLAGVEVLDLTGDLVPDLLLIEESPTLRLALAAGELSPPSTALAIQPTGLRSRDGRTRSPASGFGVMLTARTGLREQHVLHTGQSGGGNQSLLPVVLGLDGVRQADYVNFAWPDGVAQVEMALAAGQTHKVAELQRKVSSCPVLFAWNGERFGFVTDFAGVGGLGYFVAPGVSAPPQVLEHVKIEPEQLRPRDGFYELRVTEPMEETAYMDRLELLAIDHPADQPVFPDERLAINGPPPTHELLVVERPVFPARATCKNVAEPTLRAGGTPALLGKARPGVSPRPDTGGGEWPRSDERSPEEVDCTDNLARVDRVYAYEPPLDRRYIGFCRPHTLELDFGDRLAQFSPRDRVFLFLHGFIEYPYSQTVYAASQSRVGWEPVRVEKLGRDGSWQTIVSDGGAPGGMTRMWTIELTGQLDGCRKLRLTTNLELYYDQVFVARHAGLDRVTTRSVSLVSAELRRAGFAREYSPDGRLPLIYDYESSDPTAPFHVLKGAYTRYGPVKELLAEFDDQYVLVGPGDEIALRFDAASLPPLPAGQARSFVLVSHAWCKDMDLYTATPQTLEPLPFRGMSRYPPPPGERYPDGREHQAFRRTYNTRWVE